MQLSPALPVQLLSKGMVSTWYQGQSRAVKLRVPPPGEFGKQASEAGSLSTQAGLRVSLTVKVRARVRVRADVLGTRPVGSGHTGMASPKA